MAAPLIQPDPAPSVVFVVRADAAEMVRDLIDAARLTVSPVATGPGQMPRLEVTPPAVVVQLPPGGMHVRELQVLHLIALGRTNPAIARALYLGENTVKTYVKRLLKTLNARDRSHAVHIAHQRGILGGA